MKRITKKNPLGDHIVVDGNGQFHMSNYIDKLGQLEDMEEELGIDLIILLKDVHNPVDFIRKFRVRSIWIKNRYKDNKLEKADLNNLCEKGNRLDLTQKDDEVIGYYKEKLNNYGKTRALTKEELL